MYVESTEKKTFAYVRMLENFCICTYAGELSWTAKNCVNWGSFPLQCLVIYNITYGLAITLSFVVTKISKS